MPGNVTRTKQPLPVTSANQAVDIINATGNANLDGSEAILEEEIDPTNPGVPFTPAKESGGNLDAITANTGRLPARGATTSASAMPVSLATDQIPLPSRNVDAKSNPLGEDLRSPLIVKLDHLIDMLTIQSKARATAELLSPTLFWGQSFTVSAKTVNGWPVSTGWVYQIGRVNGTTTPINYTVGNNSSFVSFPMDTEGIKRVTFVISIVAGTTISGQTLPTTLQVAPVVSDLTNGDGYSIDMPTAGGSGAPSLVKGWAPLLAPGGTSPWTDITSLLPAVGAAGDGAAVAIGPFEISAPRVALKLKAATWYGDPTGTNPGLPTLMQIIGFGQS